jgi:redox-sensing transcriptional repressor
MPLLSDILVGRLSLYRRLLAEVAAAGTTHIFSHQLANMAGCTPAQVRRDVMQIGYSGSPARGYDVRELAESIGDLLDADAPAGMALVGVGNLGRAILCHFVGRTPKFSIEAAFDTDPAKTDRVICGCRCHPVSRLEEILRARDIQVALVAVPKEAAQETADALCAAGVRGLVNFAPVRLYVPEGVYVENVDVTMALERVAYFSRDRVAERV